MRTYKLILQLPVTYDILNSPYLLPVTIVLSKYTLYRVTIVIRLNLLLHIRYQLLVTYDIENPLHIRVTYDFYNLFSLDTSYQDVLFEIYCPYPLLPYIYP